MNRLQQKLFCLTILMLFAQVGAGIAVKILTVRVIILVRAYLLLLSNDYANRLFKRSRRWLTKKSIDMRLLKWSCLTTPI